MKPASAGTRTAMGSRRAGSGPAKRPVILPMKPKKMTGMMKAQRRVTGWRMRYQKSRRASWKVVEIMMVSLAGTFVSDANR